MKSTQKLREKRKTLLWFQIFQPLIFMEIFQILEMLELKDDPWLPCDLGNNER